jgi:2-oxoglutarate dehydrogenase E2 component (dihydrolipoamide succinyltransferase)
MVGGDVLVEVKVPALAESIAEATLVNWLKRPGEPVKQGENLIDIETDKVMLEVTAPEDGVLKEIIKDDSSEVMSDEVIAVIDTDATLSAVPNLPPIIEATTKQRASVVEIGTTQLSPAVRKLLEEHHLKPSDIANTAKPGRLSKEDVLIYLETRKAQVAKEKEPTPSKPAAPKDLRDVAKPEKSHKETPWGERADRRVPMTRIRKRIAERLLAAQHENAILTTFNEADMQPVIQLREQYREKFEERHGVRLGFMAFFVMAVVAALKRFPTVNASIEGDDIVHHDYYDIGIAISSPRGLVVPILRDADKLTVAEIESAITEFARKAEHNELTVEELSGGTFSITNGGVFGSLLSTPILNPPQSGILGMHKIQERPVADQGEIVIRPMMYLALSYDHRIIDGSEAVRFLVTIKECIEEPNRLLLQI